MSWGSETKLAKLSAHRLQNSKILNKNNGNQNIVNGHWNSVAEALRSDDIFLQRILRITEWFSVWNSSQRCQFFSWFLQRSNKHELEYLQGWFIQRSPVLRQDFTTVLPREISLYIFSFLDPRSLSRCAAVSWYWRFLTEQDYLWIQKCGQHGWFLPYVPAQREYGAWKYHYITCTEALDTQIISLKFDLEKKSIEDSNNNKSILETLNLLKSVNQEKSLRFHDDFTRPPWQGPDKNPKIFENDHKSLLDGSYSLSRKTTHRNMLSRFQSAPGIIKLGRSWKTKALSRENKIGQRDNPLLSKTSILSKSLNDVSKLNTRYLEMESSFYDVNLKQSGYSTSRGIKTTIYQRNSIPVHATDSVRPPNTCKVGYRTDRGTIGSTAGNPRVVFLSSRIPAKELLLDCVLYGIIAIPYDYEGTTLDSLMLKLELVLGAKQARSVAFVLDGNEADGYLNLVEGVKLNAENMKDENLQTFWRRIVYNIRPNKLETLDIFWPIATTENGIALITEIQNVTGMVVSCPVGFVGSYNRFETDWLVEYTEGKAPLSTASKVFNIAKLRRWGYYCKYLEEALSEIRIIMHDSIRNYHVDIASRVIGELTFRLTKITTVTVAEQLGKSMEKVLGQIRAEEDEDGFQRKFENLKNMLELEFSLQERKRNHFVEDQSTFLASVKGSGHESRYACVQKILEIEADHVQKLKILYDMYHKPLIACLQRSRPIISKAIIKILYSDCETLLKVDEDVLNCVVQRVADWTENQHVGDVYVKFSTNLRAYSNFLNNYPAILATLQKYEDENPVFRAFLEGQRIRSECQGLSVSELLLSPAEILHKRSQILSVLLNCTPKDHEDRKFVLSAQSKIQDISNAFDQAKDRIRNEEIFEMLEKRIKNCPQMAEPGRNLLKEMHVSQLCVSKNKTEEDKMCNAYLKTKDLVLFLFDDVLLVTVKVNKYRPFSRAVASRLAFVTLFALDRLKIEDIPDNKYVTNAFRLLCGKQRILCKCGKLEEKLANVAIISNRIKLAIPLASSIVSEANRGQ